MEKLIELLNQYETEIKKSDKKRQYTNAKKLYKNGWSYKDGAILLISKHYGFIEWLVENDKIDKEKIDTRLVRNVESHYDEDGYWIENSYEDYSITDTLLMLLSISNSPIEDLISILK